MTPALIAASLWAIAATVTALLPMRLQYAPGLILLGLAVPLLAWLGYDRGLWAVLLALLAILSLFRRPLIYLVRKAISRL